MWYEVTSRKHKTIKKIPPRFSFKYFIATNYFKKNPLFTLHHFAISQAQKNQPKTYFLWFIYTQTAIRYLKINQRVEVGQIANSNMICKYTKRPTNKKMPKTHTKMNVKLDKVENFKTLRILKNLKACKSLQSGQLRFLARFSWNI